MNQYVELIVYAGGIEQGIVQVNENIHIGKTSQLTDQEGQQQE